MLLVHPALPPAASPLKFRLPFFCTVHTYIRPQLSERDGLRGFEREEDLTDLGPQGYPLGTGERLGWDFNTQPLCECYSALIV